MDHSCSNLYLFNESKRQLWLASEQLLRQVLPSRVQLLVHGLRVVDPGDVLLPQLPLVVAPDLVSRTALPLTLVVVILVNRRASDPSSLNGQSGCRVARAVCPARLVYGLHMGF